MKSLVHPSSDPAFAAFEVRFRSLARGGPAVGFPCDALGHVELDALSESARLAYLHARAMVGREYAAPVVGPRWPA